MRTRFMILILRQSSPPYFGCTRYHCDNHSESEPLPQSVQNSRGCNAEAFDEQRRN